MYDKPGAYNSGPSKLLLFTKLIQKFHSSEHDRR